MSFLGCIDPATHVRSCLHWISRESMRHCEIGRLNMGNSCASLLFLYLNLLTSLPFSLARPNTLAVLSTLPYGVSAAMPPASALASLPVSVAPLSSLFLVPVTASQPLVERLPELTIATEQPQQDAQIKNRIFNYYFLFLAILVVALAVLLWWIHRRRQREQEQIRLRGQHALFRDVERWAIRRYNRPPTVEGLDEAGEAPPPYKHKEDTLEYFQPEDVSPELTGRIAVPQRALRRGSTEHVQLPDYVETIQVRNVDRDSVTTQPAASIVTARVIGSSP